MSARRYPHSGAEKGVNVRTQVVLSKEKAGVEKGRKRKGENKSEQ